MRPTSRSVEPRICFETSSVAAGAVVPLGPLGAPGAPVAVTGVPVVVALIDGRLGGGRSQRATGETTHRFQISAVT